MAIKLFINILLFQELLRYSGNDESSRSDPRLWW
jgi:hypothetical protein